MKLVSATFVEGIELMPGHPTYYQTNPGNVEKDPQF